MSYKTVLDLRSTALLLGGIGLTLAPHLGRLPFWFSGLLAAISLWRYVATSHGWRLPPLVVRVFIVGLAIVGIYHHFGTLVGRDAGVALLVVMLILKLLELKKRRDVMVVLLLCYFALSTHFLYTQSLWLAAYIAVVAWLLISLHIYLTQEQGEGGGKLKRDLLFGAKLVAQAVPLALVVFLLFPRASGPLWGLPQDVYASMTGLSDEMTPGAISNLGQSDAIAFRVAFKGELPKPEQRYWRGPVFWETDGRTWRNADAMSNYAAATTTRARFDQFSNPVQYTITLEPSNKRWLFALDLPAISPDLGNLTADFQIIARRRVRERSRYEMLSYLDYNTGLLSPYEHQRALRLPRNKNPRAIALGRELRQKYGNPRDIVRQMLLIYREQPFVYTLTPPLLQGSSPVDQFLFTTRKGFCEHYSSSFVTVMRAAGVPARVVTGYQGGELNPMGDYLIVRQRDAHAWAEVWLEGEGWVRIDPTAAVAPERIEQSIEPGQQQQGEAIRFKEHTGPLAEWMKQVRFGVDTINNSWNQWVLGFDRSAQRKMLSELGVTITNWREMVPILMAAVLTVLALAALFTFLPKRQHRDPVVTIYDRFCQKLARQGFARQPAESPSEFAARVGRGRPDLKATVDRITSLYLALRYGPQKSALHLTHFKQAVTKFKP